MRYTCWVLKLQNESTFSIPCNIIIIFSLRLGLCLQNQKNRFLFVKYFALKQIPVFKVYLSVQSSTKQKVLVDVKIPWIRCIERLLADFDRPFWSVDFSRYDLYLWSEIHCLVPLFKVNKSRIDLNLSSLFVLCV